MYLKVSCVCAMQTAVLFVRPRGWHLLEKHMHVDGQAVPAAIFDFALYFFHNAKELLKRNTGKPRAFIDVFCKSQKRLSAAVL